MRKLYMARLVGRIVSTTKSAYKVMVLWLLLVAAIGVVSFQTFDAYPLLYYLSNI